MAEEGKAEEIIIIEEDGGLSDDKSSEAQPEEAEEKKKKKQLLIIIGLLIMGGFPVHRISWLDGYKTGQLVARGADGAVMPYPPSSLAAAGHCSHWA